MLPLLLVMAAPNTPLTSAAGLRVQKPCGEIECDGYYYCDPAQLLCRACEPVCSNSSRSFHPDTCEAYCQDYIFDNVKGYLRATSDIINTMYWQQTVMLILLVVLITLQGSIIARKWYKSFKARRQRRMEDKRFKEKLAAVQYTINNNNSLTDGTIKCITQPSTMGSTVPSSTLRTTQTNNTLGSVKQPNTAGQTLPLANEEPSEDATLDYVVYVNQCLSHSPST